MAKFDLTSVMGQYLDRHLVFPLLEFLSAKQIYDENELLHGKLDILSKTNMLDYAIDIRKQLYPDQEIPETFLQEENKKKPYLKKCYAPVCSSKCDDVTTPYVCGLGGGISFSTVFDECYSRPTIVLEGKMKAEECRMSKALKERRVQVVSQLQELQEAVAPILGLLANEEAMKTMETNRDPKNLLNFLIKEYQITMEMMESLYRLAKYRYDCGNYSITTGYLYFYLLVVPTNDRNYLNVLWGKLASEILVQNWETALEDLSKLREFIDGSTFATPLELLQQRTWLIHWSLFVFFNHAKGRDLIIEMFLYRPHYLNAIQTMCPHILRYLATAVIINRTRRSAVKDLVKVIQQEAYTYRDPITEFLEHLLVNFDFDGARQKLHECQIVLFNDFFLIACLEEFIENARLMIFETFCRIHQCISISMLAEKLNMNPDEAECWIVNLIRNARLDAKIDSKLGHVVMGSQPLSPYQQLVEKIDTLSVRSEALQALIEKKLKSRTQDLRWGTQEF